MLLNTNTMVGASPSENGAPILLIVHQASLRLQFSRECDAAAFVFFQKACVFFQKACVFFQKACVFFQTAFTFWKKQGVAAGARFAPLVHHFPMTMHQPSSCLSAVCHPKVHLVHDIFQPKNAYFCYFHGASSAI